MAKKTPPKKTAPKRATNTKPKEEKYKSLNRKKGTYYDLHREEQRDKQQARRKLIKDGKIIPGTRHDKPKGKKAEKPKTKKELEKHRADMARQKRNSRERQRQSQIEAFLKEFPMPKSKL